jgi:hypothetical protein
MAYNIITHHKAYLDSAARLYQQHYNVRDHEDHNAYDTSVFIWIDHMQRESFIGVLAVNEDQEVIGFMFGYDTPDTSPRMTEIIHKRLGAEWTENTFMVDGFAMHWEHGSPELAQRLHDGLLKRVQEAGYARLRMRVEVPRLDGLQPMLESSGWQEFEALRGLPHLVWMGKVLG